jgi:hypothetical protein
LNFFCNSGFSGLPSPGNNNHAPCFKGFFHILCSPTPIICHLLPLFCGANSKIENGRIVKQKWGETLPLSLLRKVLKANPEYKFAIFTQDMVLGDNIAFGKAIGFAPLALGEARMEVISGDFAITPPPH